MNIKLLALVILSLTGSSIILFVPPQNYVIIAALSIITALFIAIFSSYFVGRKVQILIGIYIGIFMFSNFLTGFNLLNTILLTSFIMGLSLLL